jgi:hypothetical protein
MASRRSWVRIPSAPPKHAPRKCAIYRRCSPWHAGHWVRGTVDLLTTKRQNLSSYRAFVAPEAMGFDLLTCLIRGVHCLVPGVDDLASQLRLSAFDPGIRSHLSRFLCFFEMVFGPCGLVRRAQGLAAAISRRSQPPQSPFIHNGKFGERVPIGKFQDRLA